MNQKPDSIIWEKYSSLLGFIALVLAVAKAIADFFNPNGNQWPIPVIVLLIILTIPLFLNLYKTAFLTKKTSAILLPQTTHLPDNQKKMAKLGVISFALFYIFIFIVVIKYVYIASGPKLLFPVAQLGEQLIIIAEFDDSHAKNAGLDAPNRIYNLIIDRVTESKVRLRVEKYPEIIANKEQARLVMKTYGATLLIWGFYDDGGAEANIELDKDKALSAQTDFIPATPESFSFKRVSSQTSYLAFFSLGMLYLNPETYDTANSLFSSAIDSAYSTGEAARPYPWEALMWRGNIYSWTNQYDLSISDYTKAVDLYPHREGYFNRGIAYENQERYQEAIVDYTKAIEIDPQYKEAYFNRGNVYINQERYQEAIEDYTKVIEIDPQYKEAYNGRGIAYGNQERYQEAIKDYTKAIEIDPQYKEAYLNRGNVYGADGKYKEAIADYTKAIELDPQYKGAYLNRGYVYGADEKYKEAIAEYTKAIELDPQYKEAYFNRGISYSVQERYEEAIADYTKAIEIDPQYKEAYFNRANVYGADEKYKEAIADYTKAIELDPQYKGAYLNRGYVYGVDGKYKEAIADYTKAIELDPQYKEAYFNRGFSYSVQERYEEAIKDYNKTLEIDGDCSSCYIGRGNTYADWNKFDLAVADYQKGIQLNPDSYTYCVMGITFSKMGEFNDAVTAISSGVAMDIDNQYPWCKTALESIKLGTPVP